MINGKLLIEGLLLVYIIVLFPASFAVDFRID